MVVACKRDWKITLSLRETQIQKNGDRPGYSICTTLVAEIETGPNGIQRDFCEQPSIVEDRIKGRDESVGTSLPILQA